MTEYRPVPEDRTDEARRITNDSFAASSGPYDPDELDERFRRYWSFGEEWGLFEDDELLSVCTHIGFTARLRDAWVPLAGLTGVATPPERRRKGYVGELVEASLAEYRDRGWPLSALHPFAESFYARYGWATGCRYQVGTVDPAALSGVDAASAGRFRRVDEDEYEPLEPVYESWLDGVTLATRRSPDWWRDRVFQDHDRELFRYAWERDGEVRGYLVYRVESGDDGATMDVREMAYVDHGAYLNLLRFCRDHDSQVSEVRVSGRDHGRLLDVVGDRDAVELEVAAGQMVRVVDVPAALTAVTYPGVADLDLVLAVEDDHAGWNDGTWAVAVRDGEATVEPTGRDPDATLGIGTLSQLLVGYGSVDHAQAGRDLRVHAPGTADRLAALFPERPSYLPENF